jgi:adenylosuccinate lyase
MTTDHETYQSPLTWRYGSPEMRAVWSEANKRRLMRRVWMALAEAQHSAGLIAADQIADLRRTMDAIDIDRATEIERETRHDVMAEIRTWAEQARVGGGVLHLGATSADITDNVEAMRIADSLGLVRSRLVDVIAALATRVLETADIVTLGWTHLQPAAPTTVGYRLAVNLQDFAADLGLLDGARTGLRGKGFKGAVGTSATYAALLEGTGVTAAELEADAMGRLGLRAADVTSQVAPRKDDWRVMNVLAGIAASASTLAFNVRLLQSPPFGEWSEGFAAGQVGSTAMPWKRNPINAENIDSLARFVAALPGVAWQNEAVLLLERTLDDSANRRLILPEGFLATDEILVRTRRLCDGLSVESTAIRANLERFGPFAASEAVLVAAARAGGDRQALHETIRRHALSAWACVERGEANPLCALLAGEPAITAFLDSDAVRRLVAHPERHIGDAAPRARAMAAKAAISIGKVAAGE